MNMQTPRGGFRRRLTLITGSVGLFCLGIAAGCSDVTDAALADDEIAAAATESMPTSISITPKYDTIAPGESATLVARNQVGTPTSLVTWRSSDPTTVSVSSNGQITGHRTGRAVVEARTLARNAADWAMVYVMGAASGPTPAPAPTTDVAAVSIMPTSANMTAGQSMQFEARAYDSADRRIAVTFTWSSSNPTVATVSATGFVTARSAGGAMVTASAGGKSVSAPVTVTGGTQPETPVISSVTVSPGQASGPPGSTVQLNAQALDQNGNVMSGVTFTWSSSNTSVASVSSSGFVTGVNAGTATVTATAGGHSASSTITVTQPAPTPVITTVSVSPGQASGPPGSTVQLSAQARDQNGNVMSGVTFSWTSSDASVATVNASGFVTAVAAGTATISAAAGGQSGSSAITVTQPPATPTVASVAVTPAQASGPPGSTVQLNAQARDQNGNVMTGVTFTWTSSNTSVATVNASGFVTAVSPGSATVTASADGHSGSSAITVTQPAPVVTTVAVSPSVTSVVRGSTVQLSAQARDQNGNVMTGVTFTWTSSNNAVATVNTAGLVTGVAAGMATVTATASGRNGSSAVTVTNPTTPPPGQRSYVFTSDFSTSLGTSLTAVTDGGRWNIESVTPETMQIISSAGLDFPTSNVMQMIATSARQGFAIIRKTGMPLPVVGEVRSYRWYIRMMQPDGLIDYQTHPIQDGNNASTTNWMFIVYNGGGGSGIPNGRWQPQFWPDGEPVYNNRRWYGPVLNKNETYRFELQVVRTGANTFNMHVRIYNAAGTLIADDDDITNIGTTMRLSQNPTFTFPNIAWLDGLNAGNNGIGSLPAGSNFTYAYQGGFAVCSGDWCGPYVPGEGR